MGQYHYLVNLDKKEFIHPNQIGNGLKLREQTGWEYSTSTALVMLLAGSSRDGGRGGGDFRACHPLVGSWVGDRVAFIGDYARPADVPRSNARRVYEECSAARSVKSPPKKRKGWTNISPQVREMMSAEFGIRYQGNGWLNIVEGKNGRAAPALVPDLVITPKA